MVGAQSDKFKLIGAVDLRAVLGFQREQGDCVAWGRGDAGAEGDELESGGDAGVLLFGCCERDTCARVFPHGHNGEGAGRRECYD
jgi:hypothetical protein